MGKQEGGRLAAVQSQPTIRDFCCDFSTLHVRLRNKSCVFPGHPTSYYFSRFCCLLQRSIMRTITTPYIECSKMLLLSGSFS